MSTVLPGNTQAIMLLTAPLIMGRGGPSSDVLTPGEYKRLARFLHDKHREPASLIEPDGDELIRECQAVINSNRLRRLLDRGFLLSQAIERWQARAIWVVSRADAHYPRRLKERLRDNAPPILYGCGDAAILNTGGLAIVGSRHVDDALVEYTEEVGRLTAKARHTLVSGGARGIDQAAMRGALKAGGKVVGVLADSLERAALNREHRSMLIEGQLVLISPYDPALGFNVGHAMQRNKLIYALADAALVVSSDYEKGGTWAGAVEQLEKLHFVPVYVRANGEAGKGSEALHRKGALSWPNPKTPDEFAAALTVQPRPPEELPIQGQLRLSLLNEPAQEYGVQDEEHQPDLGLLARDPAASATPAEALFATVRSLLTGMNAAKTDAEVATELNVTTSQAKAWLERLVDESVLEKCSRPVRYRVVSSRAAEASLFDKRG